MNREERLSVLRLWAKLGLATEEEKADLGFVFAEFKPHDEKDGWLMHPRKRTVLEEQQSVASRGKAGADRRWNSGTAPKAGPTKANTPVGENEIYW